MHRNDEISGNVLKIDLIDFG